MLGPAVLALGALQAQMALGFLIGETPGPMGRLVTLDLETWRFGGFSFLGAAEPEVMHPFLGEGTLRPDDILVDLREEASVPIRPDALRLSVGRLDEWRPPEGRVVLCCSSGVRAWRGARTLAARGIGPVALWACGT